MVDVEKITLDSDLQEKTYEKLQKELAEVGGETLDDEININDLILDGSFAEFLLENEIRLQTLKTLCAGIKKRGLDTKAGSSFNLLESYLDDVGDREKMEKGYRKFISKLEEPTKLDGMKDEEVRRVKLYLSINKDAALETYNIMKNFESIDRGFGINTLSGTGMDTKDINIFQGVKGVIKEKYQNDESFIELEYPGYKNLDATSQSIKTFLENHKGVLSGDYLDWDGTKLEVAHIKDEGYIIDRETVVSKLNEYNDKRIEENKKIIEAVDIDLPVSDFSNSNGEIKYKGDVFTVENMMLYFGDKLKQAINNVGDFVDDLEKTRLLDECKDEIFNNMKNKLLFDSNVKDEGLPNKKEDDKPDDGSVEKKKPSEDPEKGSGGSEFLVDGNMVRLTPKLKQKLKELGFYEELNGKVKFDISKIKEYLISLESMSWKKLQKRKSLDRQTWIVAVQVALNYLNSEDGESGTLLINGQYGSATINAIKSFQQSIGGLKVDGKPGPNTIIKLVEKISGKEKKEEQKKQEEEKKEEQKKQEEEKKEEQKKQGEDVNTKNVSVSQKTGVNVNNNVNTQSDSTIIVKGDNSGTIYGSVNNTEVKTNITVNNNSK